MRDKETGQGPLGAAQGVQDGWDRRRGRPEGKRACERAGADIPRRRARDGGDGAARPSRPRRGPRTRGSAGMGDPEAKPPRAARRAPRASRERRTIAPGGQGPVGSRRGGVGSRERPTGDPEGKPPGRRAEAPRGPITSRRENGVRGPRRGGAVGGGTPGDGRGLWSDSGYNPTAISMSYACGIPPMRGTHALSSCDAQPRAGRREERP